MHGFNPQRASMRTLIIFNGPGIQAKQKLSNVRIIDFAPTLAKLLDLPALRDNNGRVLDEALGASR
jgi:predicted AlkP superfamily phosphohydrolase/phosphomutase